MRRTDRQAAKRQIERGGTAVTHTPKLQRPSTPSARQDAYAVPVMFTCNLAADRWKAGGESLLINATDADTDKYLEKATFNNVSDCY